MMDAINGYRNRPKLSSDDDSEDSDKECCVWKRAVKKVDENQILQKVHVEEVSAEPVETNKRKRNTVWSDILEDELISEDVGAVLLKNKPAHYGSRGHESYDYTLKYADSNIRNDSDCTMSEDDMSGSEIKTEKSVSFHHNSFKSQKFVKLDSTEREAARKINKVLNEKKVYLIHRIVKYVGIEKAIALLKMTEEIEDNGGMLINTQARRRTPGGVYIQLLKSDKDVSKEAVDKIFEGELPCKDLKKFYNERKKQKKLYKKKFAKVSKDQVKIEKTEVQEMESMDDTEPCVAVEVKRENAVSDTPTPVVVLPLKNSDSELEDGEIED